ncbi:MAG: kinase [Halanaerobiales bacterium]|nr:kinase [Halanaerobiales bacterium]
MIQRVIAWLSERNVPYLIEEKAAKILGEEERRATYTCLRKRVDLIIIFGGDGTFLHTAHHFFGSNIPLLGINIGRLGFLTEIEINELDEALNYLLEEKYQVEKRMILSSKVLSKGREVYRSQALNDVVIHRGAKSRLIKIELYINDEIVNSYRADGLIVATPTGSTAYSLSAGGPIVNPQIRAIIITPICPHTLYIRPMVISDREKLKIVVKSEDMQSEDIMKVTADGRSDYALSSGDEIQIAASSQEILIIKLPERTFYTILHKKMRVGFI